MANLQDFENMHGQLSQQEQALLNACLKGDLYFKQTIPRPKVAVANGVGANLIRAEFISWLVANDVPQYRINPAGLKLNGAWVSGQLNLTHLKIDVALSFINCHFEEKLNFDFIELDAPLEFNGCLLAKGLGAHYAKIKKAVHFINSKENPFESNDEICLHHAVIEADVYFTGANLRANYPRSALHADNARILGSLFFSESNNPEGNNYRFASEGPIRLLGATIDGGLYCIGARLDAGNGRCTIGLDGAVVGGNILFSESNSFRFESYGELRLADTRVKGQLTFSGSLLCVKDSENVVQADCLKVVGNVTFREASKLRFESFGQICMRGAKIGGSLVCEGVLLMADNNKCICSLGLDRTIVDGGVFFTRGHSFPFESYRQIRMLGVVIGGDLSCNGVLFEPPNGETAFFAESLQVAGCIKLLSIMSSTSISFVASTVRSGFIFVCESPLNYLNISHCSVGFLQSTIGSWGEGLSLDGLVYGSFREQSWTKADYLTWLKKQSPDDYGNKENPKHFKHQPWRQLISVLRKVGNDDTAFEIGIAFEERRYKINHVQGSLARRLHQLFGLLAGYGYAPLRLFKWSVAVWIFSAMIYWCAAYQGTFAPSDPLVFQKESLNSCRSVNSQGKFDRTIINNKEKTGDTHNWYTCGALSGEYATFSPLAYSLDVILPVVDLGQEKAWSPYIDTPYNNAVDEFFANFTWNHVIRLIIWMEVLFGWVASLMFVAVLTGLTDRNRSHG